METKERIMNLLADKLGYERCEIKEEQDLVTELGIDLSKDYFAQPDSKIRIVREQCNVFKFKSSNPSRTDAQQFYYSAQTGASYLNK